MRLTLRSRYAVTTSVNAYGRFWANLIGHDFQARLLEVLKARAGIDAAGLAALRAKGVI